MLGDINKKETFAKLSTLAEAERYTEYAQKVEKEMKHALEELVASHLAWQLVQDLPLDGVWPRLWFYLG